MFRKPLLVFLIIRFSPAVELGHVGVLNFLAARELISLSNRILSPRSLA